MKRLRGVFVRCCLCVGLAVSWPVQGIALSAAQEAGSAPSAARTDVSASDSGASASAPVKLIPSLQLSPPSGNDAAQSIFFPPDVTMLGDEEVDKLRACADVLKQSPRRSILLVAYSDDLGSRSYNIAIAEQRLAAVSAALRSLGVERGQIRRHRSNSVKIASFVCSNEACRQRLRRVDFSCKA
ncbi:OmpA family protein [Propionivibrio dicarboxylicus]|uniref:OmpA family protein n=1 Tax=Propionivibrio dicarboxylicus TaxID=83767 RepID=A0A1G8IXV6_9RHOO|nr:OmpA family protein [Propionivibrio dicarboxylicus]SDI23567.1 OmpA family protein [Propionivibrio dicarboxylicus]